MAAETLVSSMLTISRDPVPAMRAKLTARFEPSTATKESDPSVSSESIAFAEMCDGIGRPSGDRQIMLAWAAGAAGTVRMLSIRTGETLDWPPRLLRIFD